MNGKFWANVALCCLLFIAFVAGVRAMSVSSVTELLKPTVKVPEDKKELLEQVRLTRGGIRVTKENSEVDAIFTFENSSEHDVRNIKIVCRIFSRNGHFLGNHMWLFSETIEKSSQKTLMSEGSRKLIPEKTRKVCQITDMDIVSEPIIKVKRSHGEASHDDTKPKESGAGGH